MIDVIQIIVVYILRFLLRILYVFPIKEKRVLFSSFKGIGYSCNPKYISKYMEEKGGWEIIWAMHDGKKKADMDKVIVCKYHSLKYFYYLSTCQVAIDNVGFISIYPRRQKQLFINTWHGGGCYKNAGFAEKHISCAKQIRKRLSLKNTNLYVSSSNFFSEKVIREQFKYNGEVIEKGMPRNDILIKIDEAKKKKIDEKVRKYFGISTEMKILLYAPTWRYSKEKIYNIDFEKIIGVLRSKFGGEWIILYRLHHFTKERKKADGVNRENVVKASNYPDMQELLLICDALVTDYSSSIWDFSFTYKPCFLFTEDLDEYIDSRGFVKDIFTWGFPVCKTEEELEKAILNFNYEDNIEQMDRHHAELKSFETGSASKYIVQYINQYFEQEI